jgi:DNA-binding beta-propeller fold protein YncE
LKRTINLGLCAAALALLLSCGGRNSSSSSSSTAKTSGIKKRAFVSNNFQNQVDIVNAANDTVNSVLSTTTTGATTSTLANTITVGTAPTQMVLTADKKLTLVFDHGSNTIAVINNATETTNGQIPLPDFTESFVAGTDSKTVFVAVPNAPISGQTAGAVELLDASAGTLTNSVAVPRARRLVLSHNGNRLLIFADGTDQMWVMDTASKTVTPLSGFDRPFSAVFSTDDSKAYILNCGPECGGTTAKVTVLDMATNTPGASVAVSAATVGLLDSSGNLFVAGTAGGAGRLDVVNASSLAVSKSGVAISDGTHTLMALGSNSKLFVGARACSSAVQGCLSIVDTAAGSAVLSAAGAGDVTGIEPISGRNVVYVIEGGELVIYDTTTSKPQTTQIDIVGKAFDVRVVD